jgi:hypothetical protein
MSEKLLKTARAEISAVVTMITDGAVPNYETFLLLRARLKAWRQIEEEILRLRNEDDDDGDST